jgi:hypothetical protein
MLLLLCLCSQPLRAASTLFYEQEGTPFALKDSVGVHRRQGAPKAGALANRVAARVLELESKHGVELLRNCTSILSRGTDRLLATALLHSKEPFHITVLGGSNSAGGKLNEGETSWPAKLQSALRRTFSPERTIVVSNAAQGDTTSRWSVKNLVQNVHPATSLLLWEVR